MITDIPQRYLDFIGFNKKDKQIYEWCYKRLGQEYRGFTTKQIYNYIKSDRANIRKSLNKLVQMGVLSRDKFSTKKGRNTFLYTFINEEKVIFYIMKHLRIGFGELDQILLDRGYYDD